MFFELISFDICPYVQRSVIVLKHKKVDFKLTFIDLANPPEWFDKISPLGKVPLLLVRPSASGAGDPTVLFESAIINEYVDEVTPPSLLPKDPLEKARERAWIAVSGEMMMSMYPIMSSPNTPDGVKEAEEARGEIWEMLSRVEEAVQGGSFFSRGGFSLVDAAFAPVFMRLLMMKSFHPGKNPSAWTALPKTRRWAEALLALPEVRDSVVPDFKEKYVGYLRKRGSPAADEII